MTNDTTIRSGEDTLRLLGLINANWMAPAIRTACVLRLPEEMADAPQRTERLAQATGCDADALHRLLRALVAIEVCEEPDRGVFALAPMGELLLDDAPQSLRAWALLVGGPHWQRWGELDLSVRTGLSQRRRAGAADGFDHFDGDPATAALFHRAMVDLTRRIAPAVVRAIDVPNRARIVDVGGGSGELLAHLLVEHPRSSGVLFDLPHALRDAPAVLERAAVGHRCELVAGSFFDGVPADGDLYLLKSVLHNWDDARSIALLRQCARAMPPGSRLCAIERLLPDRVGNSMHDRSIARSDLNMLVSLSGRERGRAEFERLFDAAGLALTTVDATGADFHVVQARAR
jgi:SAM-dependent methyltransferase